jgi:hypothetical protein
LFWSGLTAFGRWWIGELRGMVRPVKSGVQRTSCLVLTLEGTDVSATVEGRGRPSFPQGWPERGVTRIDELAEALDELHPRLRRLPVIVRVPLGAVHNRRVELPSAARREFERLLALELSRTTPLNPAEMLHAYAEDGRGSVAGVSAIRHYLLKRRHVTPVLERVTAAGMQVCAIECWNEDRSAPLPFAFSSCWRK